MRALGSSLLALGLLLAAVPVHAQQTGATSFTLTARNPEFAWVGESGERNPTIEVAGGQRIKVLVRNDPDNDGFHSLQVGDAPRSGNVQKAGDEVRYEFTAPASGTVPYVCPYHPATMKGTFRVAGSATDKESPGVQALGVGLAFLGAALALRRR